MLFKILMTSGINGVVTPMAGPAILVVPFILIDVAELGGIDISVVCHLTMDGCRVHLVHIGRW